MITIQNNNNNNKSNNINTKDQMMNEGSHLSCLFRLYLLQFLLFGSQLLFSLQQLLLISLSITFPLQLQQVACFTLLLAGVPAVTRRCHAPLSRTALTRCQLYLYGSIH